jgi:mgtE-like transporter
MVSRANSREFFASFKETLVGHFVGVGGIIAGLVIVWQLNVFQDPRVPWAIAVYPTLLTAKAVTNGMFSGRLNTALHIGTISPRFAGNMKTLGRIFQRILALTLATSVVMSIVSTIFGSLFWGLAPASFIDVLPVVVATMSLGLVTYLFTLPITFAAFKRGLDLDSVAYPIAATIADVFITGCYVLTVYLFFNFGHTGKYAIVLVAILPAILIVYSLLHGIRDEGFSKTMKISISALMFVAVIGSVTGAILQKINLVTSVWTINSPLRVATLFAAYPALIELIGDAALVIGSTATTKLVLGLLDPYFSAMKNHLPQILGAWAASAIAFIPISAASLFLTGTFGLPAFCLLTSVLVATNVFAMIAMTLISYALAILTFQKGLDPDHMVIPIESSIAGTITTTAFLAALFLLLHLRG